MKKTIKFLACLSKNNQTLFIIKNGDVYSVFNNTGDYMTNVYENAVLKNPLFNCREKSLVMKKEIKRLINLGYSPVKSFTPETLSVFKETKRLHEKQRRYFRDALEYVFNYND